MERHIRNTLTEVNLVTAVAVRCAIRHTDERVVSPQRISHDARRAHSEGAGRAIARRVGRTGPAAAGPTCNVMRAV